MTTGGNVKQAVDKSAIRDAATIILTRGGPEGPEVLMGQRGAKAAFMPNKFVFPGGAVDAGDGAVPLAKTINFDCGRRLAEGAGAARAHALTVAAIRELWEETGLPMAARLDWPGTPEPDWESFAAAGMMPSAEGLTYVFRAITPSGRPRRFDARFFLAEVGAIATDPDDFSRASDELSHLQWIPLGKVRHFDLPFITEVVLAEIAHTLDHGPADSVPFFDNSGPESVFRRIA
ncbi:NUDIX hydrolase [Acidimangrovimonas pyrenivorans]|uniref:NUDIX domain-containing protein n=1 Tax=Acidimangrovimonas pyrenivorans TaxID=2030798 RepID=A0ABV7AM28_9RHOB